jgi:hypothetical protein
MFTTKLSQMTLTYMALMAIGAPAALADGVHDVGHDTTKPPADDIGKCWSDTVDAYATLVRAVRVKGVQDMNWGAIAICEDRDKDVCLDMDTYGNVEGGDKDVRPIKCLDRKPAKFEIRGVRGCDIKYEVTATDLEMKGSRIKLDLKPNPDDGAFKFDGKFDPCELAGPKVVTVGGKLTIPAKAECGVYKGTVTLVAAYH